MGRVRAVCYDVVMRLPIYQVDAFTDRPFAGNPAAVVPLESWLPDATLQAVAAENNLSETAFFVPDGDGFALRWFTPTREVRLCGHATLASGHVVLDKLRPGAGEVAFRTRESGTVSVVRDGPLLTLDFPVHRAEDRTPPAELRTAVGGAPEETWLAHDNWLFVYADQAGVAALAPDFRVLATAAGHGVICTAPGDDPDVDFVSRYFVPSCGIDEDPVTGSAHCALTPYWSRRLERKTLRARQISTRGGELLCTDDGDRVRIAGRTVLYLEGFIEVPG